MAIGRQDVLQQQGVNAGGPTPEGTPPVPSGFTNRPGLPEAPPTPLSEAGNALLARITELAPTCPPAFMDQLTSAYGQLHRIAHGG